MSAIGLFGWTLWGIGDDIGFAALEHNGVGKSFIKTSSTTRKRSLNKPSKCGRKYITMTAKVDCATKIAAYLAGEVSHDELVQWADTALVEEEFPAEEGRALLAVLSQLSASRAPGFLFRVEEYQELLRELGFRLETRLVAA
jgi:hypothetical protein